MRYKKRTNIHSVHACFLFAIPGMLNGGVGGWNLNVLAVTNLKLDYLEPFPFLPLSSLLFIDVLFLME